MQKIIPDAPHEVLLILDGSTGQNAFEQAKQFDKYYDWFLKRFYFEKAVDLLNYVSIF